MYTIHGRVTDREQNPLLAADIVVKSLEIHTLSDTNGDFFLKDLPKKNIKIEISSLGYHSQEITVKPDTSNALLLIHLSSLRKDIEEVEVRGSAFSIKKENSSLSIDLIKEEFLKENRTGSLAQTLSKVPGVTAANIGSGFSKPVIRGMSKYRVIVAQDGIRMEGQAWSTHHGMSIDQNTVNHVELIKGPAMLKYGSGAIGGVMNILPAHVPINQGVTGEVSATFKSNNIFLGGSGNLIVRSGDFYTNASMSYADFGDFKVPETDYFTYPAPATAIEASHQIPLKGTIANTSGNEGSALLTMGIIKSWGLSNIEFNYYKSKCGFFDWQRLKNDSIRTLQYKNARDILHPYQKTSNLTIRNSTKIYYNKNKIVIALGMQKNVSEEYDYLSDLTGNRYEDKLKYEAMGGLDLEYDLFSLFGNVESVLDNIDNHEITAGLNLRYSSQINDGYGHVLPEYAIHQTGMYVTDAINLNKKLLINTGLRIDFNKFYMEESLNADPALGDSIFNTELIKNFPGFSFIMGLVYTPKSQCQLRINLGKSYRMPSAYELGAYGLHRHEARFIKGDSSLNSEIAYQLDLGYNQKWKRWDLTLSPFLNYFTNYLYLKPTSELRTEGQVYKYTQTQAIITGGEVSLNIYILRNLKMQIGGEYLYAINPEIMSALPETPPASVLTSFYYTLRDAGSFRKNKIGFELNKIFAQNYTVPNELQTPGCFLVNISGSTQLQIKTHELDFGVQVYNIFNTKYYNHISFYRRMQIPEPGRNIQLNMTLLF